MYYDMCAGPTNLKTFCFWYILSCVTKRYFSLILEIEWTKSGMLNLVQRFNLAEALERASPDVKKIFEAYTLDTPNANFRSDNTKIICDFFWVEYVDKYWGPRVGFTQASDDKRTWPAVDAIAE